MSEKSLGKRWLRAIEKKRSCLMAAGWTEHSRGVMRLRGAEDALYRYAYLGSICYRVSSMLNNPDYYKGFYGCLHRLWKVSHATFGVPARPAKPSA